MIYLIMWKGEEVDQFDSMREAREMVKEYNMAYGGGCTVKKTKRVD